MKVVPVLRVLKISHFSGRDWRMRQSLPEKRERVPSIKHGAEVT
jgi:hypothetical protein